MRDLESDLGLFSKRFKGVAVPKQFMNITEEREKLFDSEIKERAHARVDQKLVSAFSKISDRAKKSKTYEAEIARRERLTRLFLTCNPYYKDAEKYFEGCKGVEKIKKFNKKIQNQYKKLDSKGYIIHDEELFKSSEFRKEQYDLSFAEENAISRDVSEDYIAKHKQMFEDKPIQTTGEISLPKFKENQNYKQRCEVLYSYLQTLFSTVLNLTNNVYSSVYKRQPELPTGTEADIDVAMNQFDDSLKKYEDCVEKVEEQAKKHKIYFDSAYNKPQMDKIRSDIKDIRKNFKNFLSAGRRLEMDAHFVSLGANDAKEYKSLMDTLTNMSELLNKIARFINEGDYDKFQRNYEQVAKYFNKLPNLIDKFANVAQQEHFKKDEELANCVKHIEDLKEASEKLQTRTQRFTEEFSKAYENFMKKVKMMVLGNIVGGVASTLASTFLGSAGGVFSAFASDFKILERTTNLPTAPRS